MRVRFQELKSEFERVLRNLGFKSERAELSARLFAEASRDGVSSHGLNRFPRYVTMIRNGEIDIQATPERVGNTGPFEQWDGLLGPGNLNAFTSMERAISLSEEYGLGCVALRNTNHWMRGGAYGWQAADAGKIGICWTNTNQNMPPWGAKDARIGNNPLIISIPRANGHVVLDMAMAQFSYGALESYQRKGKALPVVGGFDTQGDLTKDPAAIEQAARPLPIGFWKGSGLSIVLDLMAAILSGGLSTKGISPDPLKEVGLSQVFVAWDVVRITGQEEAERVANEVVEHVCGSQPSESDGRVRYPGQRTIEVRRESLEKGVPVEPEIWQQVREM